MTKTIRSREELGEELNELDRRYSALLQDFNADQLNWCAASGTWSVAQCVEHVGRVNSLYLPAIKTAIARARPRSDSKDQALQTGGWFSALFLRSVSPEGTKKLPAPPAARPTSETSAVDAEEALSSLLRTHAEIREILASSNQPDLNRIRFRNPFIPVIRFTVATGILIMVGHAQRHLLQAERVTRMQDFPKASAAANKTA